MHKISALALLATSLSCSSPPAEKSIGKNGTDRTLSVYGHVITYTGGSGRACDDAVEIQGAPDIATCVEAQYAWLTEEFRRYEPMGHVSMTNERNLSIISIRTRTGKDSICFDITACGQSF